MTITYTGMTFLLSRAPGTFRLMRWKLWHIFGNRTDLLLHYVEYGILAILMLLTFKAWSLLSRRPWLGTTVVILAATLVGGLNEWTQAYTPGRSASWSDIVANLLGALSAVGVVWLFWSRRKRFTKFSPNR